MILVLRPYPTQPYSLLGPTVYSALLGLAGSCGLHIGLSLFYIILSSLACYFSILLHDYHHLIFTFYKFKIILKLRYILSLRYIK